MNAKKVLAQVGVIMSIVAAALFTFIFLIGLPGVEEALRLEYKNQNIIISEEEFRSIVMLVTIVMVVMAAMALTILIIAIISESKMNKKKNHKGLLITLLILNIIYGILLIMGQQILGLLLFLAAAIVLLVSLCLKDEQQKPATELEEKHDNENVLF